MAFNREDLITWNELAPSLQTVLRSLQTEVMENTQKTLKVATQLEAKMENDDVYNLVKEYAEKVVIPSLPTTENVSELRTDVATLNTKLKSHEEDTNPHPNTGAYFLIHRTEADYEAGQVIYVEGIPNYLMLECIKPGTSAATSPNFSLL